MVCVPIGHTIEVVLLNQHGDKASNNKSGIRSFGTYGKKKWDTMRMHHQMWETKK